MLVKMCCNSNSHKMLRGMDTGTITSEKQFSHFSENSTYTYPRPNPSIPRYSPKGLTCKCPQHLYL